MDALLPFLVLLAALVLTSAADGHDTGSVVVTVISQSNHFHSSRAQQKQQQWSQELHALSKDSIVLLSHELLLTGAAWTIVPLFKPLSVKFRDASWFVFVGEETDVNWNKFMGTLNKHNSKKEIFLGHSLQDDAPTIIHHYLNPHSLSYPCLPAGFVLSTPALLKAAEHKDNFSPNFNIDAQYELALFLKYLRSPDLREMIPEPPPGPTDGIILTHTPEFCISSSKQKLSCSTTFSQKLPSCEITGGHGTPAGVFFAVKTCQKYHDIRLPVVQETWAKDVPGGAIRYFSEVADSHYSTVDIGVPNTETGHCGKVVAIIKHFYSDESLQHISWLVIADDDTLLSVSRLTKLLSCYDPTRRILLGEVYGYLAHQNHGSSYITGGGGMVLSRAAVKSLVESGYSCPSIDYPDDMFLGSVGRQLKWDIVHSPLFHQSQPESYPDIVLKQQTAVSFHRHRPRDPFIVYQQYLTDVDPQNHSYKSEL